jgi:hypothetical protein
MLHQRLKRSSLNICSQRRWVYYFYHVHFPPYLFRFALFCSLSLSSYSLFVHFSFIVWVFELFLQQSICITFISCIVEFALSFFLLLSSCFILVHFPHCCLDFRFFKFSKHCFCNNAFVSSVRYYVIILYYFSHNFWVFLDNVSKFFVCYLHTSKCIGCHNSSFGLVTKAKGLARLRAKRKHGNHTTRS